MLEVFQAEAQAWGFRVYPESCGFDVVLEATQDTIERIAAVRRGGNHHALAAFHDDLEVGDVIGCEGKLSGTFEVLAQAMPQGRAGAWETEYTAACDFYAVVVPTAPAGFDSVAAGCGIVVFYVTPEQERPDGWRGTHKAPAGITRISNASGALRVMGYNRPALPRVEVKMAGGQPAPRAVTPWKIDAVELCLIARSRPLVRGDFARRRVTPTSLVRPGWFACEGRGKDAQWTLTGVGDSDRFVERDGMRFRARLRPDVAYPEIVEALAAEDRR